MSGEDALQRIDVVDAFTRALYIRATESNSPLVQSITSSLRQIHVAVRHLRAEAADPDSLLNSNTEDAVLYSRQLRPLVDDCEFAVKQLEAVFDTQKDTQELHGADGFRGGLEDEALRQKIAAIKSKLVTGKIEIDMFLDTVQLQGDKARNNASMDLLAMKESNLEEIKDKLDAVAQRVFQNKQVRGCYVEDEDDGWSDFKVELEKEGFSSQVLQKHKEVLRAYIRGMESRCLADGGPPPTVRGLLEYEAATSPTTPRAAQYPSSGDRDVYFAQRDASTQHESSSYLLPTSPHQGYAFPSGGAPKALSDDLSFDRPGSDISDDNSSSPSLAMISTRELMAMDSMNTSMNNLHLQPLPHHDYQSGSTRNTQALITYPPPGALSSPNKEPEYTSPAIPELLGSLPHYIPPAPGSGKSPTRLDQAPPLPGARPLQKLAPDRLGNEIPMDAQWTRVRRSLISPEVLSRAGVRYEARPDYVAILGRLSKEDIADLARQSADARAARTFRPQQNTQYLRPRSYQQPTQTYPPPPAPQPSSSYPPHSEQPPRASFVNDRRPPPPPMNGGRARSGSKSSHTDNDDSSVLWDESDSTDYDDDKTSLRSGKRHKSYRFIVDPPSKDKGTPSATVMPKPILKNKNAENHVRFDALPSDDRNHGRSPSSRYDDRDGGRRTREGSSANSKSSRYKSSGSDGGRRRRDRDDDYGRSSHYRDGYRDRDGRGSRDRTEERSRKKKAWGETLGAVGIGGAAVSLLGVLAEAAVGM